MDSIDDERCGIGGEMRALAHKGLLFAPPAAGGGAIGVASVWPAAADWIAVQATAFGNAAMQPLGAIGFIAIIVAWGAGVYFTSDESKAAANAHAAVRQERDKYRRRLVQLGRNLAHSFTRFGAGQTLRQYLENDNGYPRLRPHLSRDFRRELENGMVVYAMGDDATYEPLIEMLLDEMDALERKWKLV